MSDDSAYICPGPCNRAFEAAERAAWDGTGPDDHGITPAPGQPIWCADCRDRITDRITDLVDLVDLLEPGPLSTPPDITGVNSGPNVHASPSPSHDLRDELNRWIITTANWLRTQLHHPPVSTTEAWRHARYLQGAATAMLNRDPEGIDFGMSVDRWHRRLVNATGTGDLTHRLPGICPVCNLKGRLTRRNGSDVVGCACGARWDYDHWQFLAKAAVEARPA